MATLSSKLAWIGDELRPQIETALSRYTGLARGCPSELREAIRYSLLAPGKRLRPMLVLMSTEACGGDVSNAMAPACAVEMVHAYSLIHDDLPAMDNDDLRRGLPTCHKKFGEALAILAGDALLALAFQVIAEGVQPAEVAARCCAALAEAAGPCNLVGGQADDILGKLALGDCPNFRISENGTVPFTAKTLSTKIGTAPAVASDPSDQVAADRALERLESIHNRKTGAMIQISLRLGALVAGAGPAPLAALERFGHCLGLAFQITDDLLDVRGKEADVGKRVGKDSVQGKLTFPGLLGVDPSARRAEELVREACAAIQPLGARAGNLEAMARYVLERQQ